MFSKTFDRLWSLKLLYYRKRGKIHLCQSPAKALWENWATWWILVCDCSAVMELAWDAWTDRSISLYQPALQQLPSHHPSWISGCLSRSLTQSGFSSQQSQTKPKLCPKLSSSSSLLSPVNNLPGPPFPINPPGPSGWRRGVQPLTTSPPHLAQLLCLPFCIPFW